MERKTKFVVGARTAIFLISKMALHDAALGLVTGVSNNYTSLFILFIFHVLLAFLHLSIMVSYSLSMSMFSFIFLTSFCTSILSRTLSVCFSHLVLPLWWLCFSSFVLPVGSRSHSLYTLCQMTLNFHFQFYNSSTNQEPNAEEQHSM